MSTLRTAGHHGAVAIGVAAAVFVAQMAADAVVYLGEWAIG